MSFFFNSEVDCLSHEALHSMNLSISVFFPLHATYSCLSQTLFQSTSVILVYIVHASSISYALVTSHSIAKKYTFEFYFMASITFNLFLLRQLASLVQTTMFITSLCVTRFLVFYLGRASSLTYLLNISPSPWSIAKLCSFTLNFDHHCH